MGEKKSLCEIGYHNIKRQAFIFGLGPLHYKVVYYCGKFGEKTFAHVELILDSVDPEPRDPNLDYDRLEQMKSQGSQTGTPYVGYGVVKGQAYAFKTLATLAAILRRIIKDENPDEFRCTFTDTKHSSCWKTFFKYIARPTSAIREIIVEPSMFHHGAEEWTVFLNK
jgi:hypothetical protein